MKRDGLDSDKLFSDLGFFFQLGCCTEARYCVQNHLAGIPAARTPPSARRRALPLPWDACFVSGHSASSWATAAVTRQPEVRGGRVTTPLHLPLWSERGPCAWSFAAVVMSRFKFIGEGRCPGNAGTARRPGRPRVECGVGWPWEWHVRPASSGSSSWEK